LRRPGDDIKSVEVPAALPPCERLASPAEAEEDEAHALR
jgi:hypothetical protein